MNFSGRQRVARYTRRAVALRRRRETTRAQKKETKKMKKLMVAAAIVCAAAVSQAASILWATGSVTFNGEGSTLADTEFIGYPIAEGAKAYLFVGIAADYAALDSAEKIWGGFTANGASSTLTVGENTYNAFDVATADDTGIAYFKAQEGLATGADEYAAIIITYTADGKDYYSANTMEVLGVPLAGAAPEAGLAWGDGDYWNPENTLTTWSAAATPTPEPTSGLLLLLGVAGLALRRRRA